MIIAIFQVIVSIILIVLILLQERSAGISGLFGGESGAFYQTRRGAEKAIFTGTILFAAIFVGLAIAQLIF